MWNINLLKWFHYLGGDGLGFGLDGGAGLFGIGGWRKNNASEVFKAKP